MNETLTGMESHPLPFARTTNVARHLDTATFRRFDFRVRLDCLAPEQGRGKVTIPVAQGAASGIETRT